MLSILQRFFGIDDKPKGGSMFNQLVVYFDWKVPIN